MNSAKRSLRLSLVMFLALIFQVQGQQPTRPDQQLRPAAGIASAGAQQSAQQPQLKFAILGDTGTGGRQQYEIGQKLTATRGTFPFEFVLLLGDNMYGGENAKDFQTKFEKPYEALM